jgi:hypothetical protein
MQVAVCLLVSFLVFFPVSPLCAQNDSIAIKSPYDGARVPERPIVEGVISDTTARIWVIVHPMETRDYWVQPGVTVGKGGVWEVRVYIGRPGTIDVGKHFEMMAVANPTETLREGKVLEMWPTAQWQSEAIEVTRQ